VGFEKKPADPLTHSCKHKVEYRLSSSIRRITPASRDLEGMSDIEHNRASGGFHNSKIEGIHDEIVIPEGGTTLAEQNLFISRFREFINYVSHLMGGKELRLFDINRSSGLGQSDHEIGLATEESRELENVNHFSGRFCLSRFMNIGNYRNLMGLFDLGQYCQALIQSRTAEGGNRGTVGLVKGGLEYKRNAQSVGNFFVKCGNFKCEFTGFKNIYSPKKCEW
jgi:hypothetical protein